MRKIGARIQAGNEFKGCCRDSHEIMTVAGTLVSGSETLGYIQKGFSGALFYIVTQRVNSSIALRFLKGAWDGP